MTTTAATPPVSEADRIDALILELRRAYPPTVEMAHQEHELMWAAYRARRAAAKS